MKLSLGPKHKFLCPSSWDFIGINTNFAVQIFVKTSLLILIARTVQRKNCWTTYFNRIYHKLFRKGTNLLTDLFLNLRTMPRTDSTITCLLQSLQAGRPPRDRTECALRKSQTRHHWKPKTSTAKTWTLYY